MLTSTQLGVAGRQAGNEAGRRATTGRQACMRKDIKDTTDIMIASKCACICMCEGKQTSTCEGKQASRCEDIEDATDISIARKRTLPLLPLLLLLLRDST